MTSTGYTLERRQTGTVIEIIIRDQSGSMVGYAYCDEPDLERVAMREFRRDFEV